MAARELSDALSCHPTMVYGRMQKSVSATVYNTELTHEAAIGTGEVQRPISIGAKQVGRGSSASGGELLVLALATCYCNDVFREADAFGTVVKEVYVEAHADFDAASKPASLIEYHAKGIADAPIDAIKELIRHVDSVAEIQLTVRSGTTIGFAD